MKAFVSFIALCSGIFIHLCGANIASAWAEPQFKVQVDRKKIDQDESLSLKLEVEQQGAGLAIGQPQFEAPDFEVLNTYQSSFVQSYYENGNFGMRTTKSITSVLRPIRTGTLTIKDIRIQVGNQTLTADPITVEVGAPGSGTPPPEDYGGSVGLRGTGKRGDPRNFFVRAEINKEKLYKGEQLIVSYYLYRRVQVFNIQVTKYPTLEGFLREDLDMPIVGRLTFESTVLDGAAWERALLVRYAAYPLKEGKLKIDAMTLKANYYSGGGSGALGDENDPFFQFFRQLSPQTGTYSNEPIEIPVSPLPESGRPNDFSGAVGEFSVQSAVDRYELKAHEPVTLTLRVEGRGGVSGIEAPKVEWPSSVDLYESKSHSKTGRGGISEKTFEVILIPREEGTVTLPSVPFTFFDPGAGKYVTRATEPVTLRVNAGAPGAGGGKRNPPKPSSEAQNAPEARVWDVRTPVPGDSPTRPRLPTIAKGLLFSGLLATLGAWIWAFFYQRRRSKGGREVERIRRLQRQLETDWAELESKAREAIKNRDFEGVSAAYQDLLDGCLDSIARVYQLVDARAVPRSELIGGLVDQKKMDPHTAQKMLELMETAENIRFSGNIEKSREDANAQLLPRIQAARQHIESCIRYC